jgi:DNA polymerase I-like protein with 3'-5' exonuclease and polymerase domains
LNGFVIGQDNDSIKLKRPYFYDTYIACHVLEPELPKTLAYETSIRTREPYYKQEGKEEADQKGWSTKFDKERLYRYNGKDTCVDFEVFESQIVDIAQLAKSSRDIFDFEMRSIRLQTHMSNSGMLIDPSRLELLKQALITRWAKLQYPMDMIAGFELNVRSPLLKDYLYQPEKKGGLGLPAKYKNKRVTTDDDALVTLIAWCKKKEYESVRDDTKRKYRNKLNLIRAIREIRGIRQRLSMYVDSEQSEDGRTRSTYKWGPETGRMASSKYVDGTGYNHQTNPRDPIEVSDEDFEKYKNEYKLVETLDSGDKIIEEEEE